MKRTFVSTAAATAAAALALSACGGGDGDGGDAGGDGELSGLSMAVGSKDFTEQLVLCEIYIDALEDAGASVENVCNIQGTEAARAALLEGEIDMYAEYTGTAQLVHLGRDEPIPDSQEQYDSVAEADLEENGIVWLDYAPFNNTYALAARQDVVDQYGGITTLSELAEVNNGEENPGICVESEFNVRPDGLPGLEETYETDFTDDQISELAVGAIYQATGEGDCEFGEVFTTDGRIAQYDLVVLEDDLGFFPLYNPAPTVRQEVVDEFPAISDVLAPVTAALTNEEMTQLNARVDVDGEDPADVAEEWLADQGLVG